MCENKKLVEITYYREVSPDKTQRAVVTEKQAYDIKVLRPGIRIVKVKYDIGNACRDYVLK